MLKKSSELRQKEHLESTINIVDFDGSMETIPYKVEIYIKEDQSTESHLPKLVMVITMIF